MSEAELHLIRSRLTGGICGTRPPAASCGTRLPVGLDYDQDDRVIITPDEAVREAIATVYRRFAELGSARQVLLSLREDGLLLPRRPTGTGRVSWAQASYPAVHDFLSNPAYAGAFVFGRTRTEKRIDPAGRLITRTRLLPRDQWAVLIPDHHRGFISWETYEANTAALRANWRPPRGHGGGAPREGTALLQGLLRCGKCGRVMQTGYSGPQGQQPPVRVRPRETAVRRRARLLQHRRRRLEKTDPGRAVHRAGARVRCRLPPRRWPRPSRPVPAAAGRFELAVERARYEADRARRQYDAVEPENRLVARSLEREWEGKLAAARQAENDLRAQQARRPVTLTGDELAWISSRRRRHPGRVLGADHDHPRTQAADPRRHHRDRPVHRRPAARSPACGSSGKAGPSPGCPCP